jgi:cell division protein FtsQ
LGLAAVAGAGLFLMLTAGGKSVRAGSVLGRELERGLQLAGFGLDEVHIIGHVYTRDGDIYDAIDLDNVRTFFALDTGEVRRRIERLPWVLSADLTRVLPGRLDVRISERTPVALWRRGGEEMLIDRTGRVLARVNPGSVKELPRFAGEGANEHASSLKTLLDRLPSIASRVEVAEWVAERRWTLRLAGNVTLHLPTDRAAPVLEELARRPDLAALLAVQSRVIDLRGPGRMTLRAASTSEGSRMLPGSGT